MAHSFQIFTPQQAVIWLCCDSLVPVPCCCCVIRLQWSPVLPDSVELLALHYQMSPRMKWTVLSPNPVAAVLQAAAYLRIEIHDPHKALLCGSDWDDQQSHPSPDQLQTGQCGACSQVWWAQSVMKINQEWTLLSQYYWHTDGRRQYLAWGSAETSDAAYSKVLSKSLGKHAKYIKH